MNVLRGIPFGISRPLFENYLVEFLQKQELFDGHASDEETEEESGQSRDERHKVKKMDVDFKSRLGNGLLDLSKAVRSANFRLVHQLLKTPLTEMLSTVPPDLPNCNFNGFFVLYGAAGDYLSDGVVWEEPEKMSLKLILYDSGTHRYKIKNNKSDEGEVVMRRHKRSPLDKSIGWERHEYKLFTDETAHRHNVDGTKTIITRRVWSPWPILVHYFRVSVSRGSQPISVGQSQPSSTNTTPPSSSSSRSFQKPSSSLDQSPGSTGSSRRSLATTPTVNVPPTNMIKSEMLEEFDEMVPRASSVIRFKHEYDDEIEQVQPPRKKWKLPEPENSLNNSGEMIAIPKVESEFYSPSSSPSLEPHSQLQYPQQEQENWNEENGQWISEPSNETNNNWQIGHYAPDTIFCGDLTTFLVTIAGDVNNDAVSFGCIVEGTEFAAEQVGPYTFKIDFISTNPGIFFFFLVGKNSEGTVLYHSQTVPIFVVPTMEGQLSLAYSSFAPLEESALAQLPPSTDLIRNPFQVNAQALYPQVPEFLPGLDDFKTSSMGIKSEVAQTEQTLSPVTVPNFSIDFFSPSVFCKFRHTTRKLDLTGNNLTNIDFLEGFYELRELVLDHNYITHLTKFPYLPKLSNISLNNNRISHMGMFMDNLALANLVKLKFLSTLGNVANPAFEPYQHRYYNFRIFVVSRLPLLGILDAREVTSEERRHATAITISEDEMDNLDQHPHSTLPPSLSSSPTNFFGDPLSRSINPFRVSPPLSPNYFQSPNHNEFEFK